VAAALSLIARRSKRRLGGANLDDLVGSEPSFPHLQVKELIARIQHAL
jgi:hypothetical protein